MQQAREAERTLVWNGPGPLSPDHLIQLSPEVVPLPERWRFSPFPIAIYGDPADGRTKIDGEKLDYPASTKDRRNPMVDMAVNKLVLRLTAPDLGNSVVPLTETMMDKRLARMAASSDSGTLFERLAEIPAVQAVMELIKRPINPKDRQIVPRLVIRPGTGELDLLLHPADYVKMPDPKPFFFYVSAVNKLPEEANDFEYSRRQLVRAAAHNGVIFEVNDNGFITGFWWFSTQGNHQVVRIGEKILQNADEVQLAAAEKILLDSVAMRVCVHHGDRFFTDRSDYPMGNGEPIIRWDEWSNHSIHRDLHQMAVTLRELKYLDDHVDVSLNTPDEPKHGKRIGDAINRSDLGEGMYSAKIGRVVAMSPSGGGKVDWRSEDPNTAVHLTPLSHMTPTGTMVYTPSGTPEKTKSDGTTEKITFANVSVEARENLDAYIMRQKYANGEVIGSDRYQQLIWYENWQRNELNEHNMIPVYQEGTPQEDFTIVHLHAMPETWDGEKVEVVEPDYTLYPEVDMACGSRGGNGSFRSALSKSKWFTGKYEEDKHFLDGKTIVVLLKGHGVVMLARNPQEAVRAVKEDMLLKRPPEKTV